MTYYYAIVDVNSIVTDVVEEVEPVDETGWIEIDSYNMDLVGLWYNVNNQTFSDVGNKYLIPLKNVDGAGCGLDADKLDGLEASAFALANHTHEDMGTVGEHNHDDEYAAIDHTHTEYASVSHDHDEDYAGISHTHTEYASATHEHTGYADADHNHDSAYAPLSHTHTGFADAGHDHDSEYSPLGHTHSEYASASHTHSGYAASSHNHDSAYAAKSHTHTGYASSTHNHDSAYAGISHNHDSDYLKLSGGTVNGDLNVTESYKIDSQFVITHDGTIIKLGSVNKATTINCLSTADMILNGVGCWIPTIKPRGGNGTQNIGTPSYRFQYAYLQNSPNVSSDERLKQDIESVKDTDMLDFIEKLNVVNYAFKSEPETERIGLIAQEVEAAGGSKYVDVDEEGMYGLKTADLVYPLIGAVQALAKRVAELEAKD